MPPETVAICFLPRQGELRDAHWWSEPWDPGIATQALERLRQVQTAVETLGPPAFQALPTFDDYCSGCPFHNPRSTDPAVGCPGHPTATPAQGGGQPALTLVTA